MPVLISFYFLRLSAKIICQFLGGAGAMADLVFDFLAQLGKSLLVTFGPEDGIIAEAPHSTLLMGYLALYDAFEQVFLFDARTAAGADILLLY